MKVIADLQLHSKYSRAVSPDMVIPVMAEWGRRKGIDLLATGDWLHPLWMLELRANLEEVTEGIFRAKKDPEATRFLLSTEISSIYTQGGRVRRVHTLVFAPSFETVKKISEELLNRGCNLSSDGRPIVGLSCKELAEIVFSVDEKCLVIPAHCLLPEEMIMTQNGIKSIGKVKKNDLVLTHKGRYKKVEKVLKRRYTGEIIRIRPWYFSLGLATTPEHPYYAIRTIKRCRSTGDVCRPFGRHVNHCQAKHYQNYRPEWIKAEKIETGDILLFPVLKEMLPLKTIKITDMVDGLLKENGKVFFPGVKKNGVKNTIELSESLLRLVGYYLAEGYTSGRDEISFCFHEEERNYLEDIKVLMKEVFGLAKAREYRRKNRRSVELIFFSKVLAKLFSKLFYGAVQEKKAGNKQLPNWMLGLNPKLQKEILVGWWRGDKGYTVSRELINQMKMICLRLKIIPGIGITRAKDYQKRGHYSQIEGREIRANHDLYYLNRLSFIEDKFGLIERLRDKRLLRKLDRKHGWIDDNYAYLPVRKIEKAKYQGDVYNLEIETDNSYVSEFAAVHNCWTPWFSVYGSKGGFDSLEECFGEFSSKIYAVETGLSSDPAMNWRIKELERRAIVSFSDAHSPMKLGREATVFKGGGDFTYNDIYGAIAERFLGKNEGGLKIDYTIEFYPEEGKYHYTGHRNCQVKQTPEETRQKGTTCVVCGRQLTVGVMHRVDQLAAPELKMQPVRQAQGKNAKLKVNKNGVMFNYHPIDETRPPYVMMVQLGEILSEVYGVGVNSKKVQEEYHRLTDFFEGEFKVLLEASMDELTRVGGERMAEAVDRVRRQEIVVDPGYDGEFGKVKIWSRKASPRDKHEQMGLF